MAIRYDVGACASPKLLSNGFLRADAYLTRPGIFEYCFADGSVRRELLPPDEVFHEDSVATLSLVPLTLEHSGGLLTASNARTHTVGHVGDHVERADNLLRGRIMITDEAAVRSVESGERRELSCGYECDTEETPGTWEGQRYDAVQRSIRYNHVAITSKGRAGPEVRTRMDADTAVMVASEPGAPPPPPQREQPMARIRLNGVDYDAPEQLAQAITASQVKVTKEADGLRAELDATKARADSLDEELARERQRREDAESRTRLRALVDERVSLERSAAEILGPDAKLDQLDSLALRKAVINKVSPDAKLDDVSDAYIQGRFGHAIEVARASGGLSDLRRAATSTSSTTRCDSDDARQKLIERSANAWQRKG